MTISYNFGSSPLPNKPPDFPNAAEYWDPRGGYSSWTSGPTPRPPSSLSDRYVELHCHSAFSFLEGASHPDELVLRAKALGYPALALTDHDGLHGAMEFAKC